MRFNSPLRYPGGKGKIAPFFSEVFQENNLNGGTYVEPYVGGGAVALHLLYHGDAGNVIINDKDRSIYAFWYSVLYHCDELCKLIKDTPVTLSQWEEAKKIQDNKSDEDLLKLGFSTFFLNRTNRSGIIKGGIIGGKEQIGNYLIDARYNKNNLIRRIEDVAKYADKIQLFNMDAIELLKSLSPEMDNNFLLYLDPPYFEKGKGLYMNYYSVDDHNDIFKALNNIKNKNWILTYDDKPFIYNLYKDCNIYEYTLNYSAATKGLGKEYIVFSDSCKVPSSNVISLKVAK